MILLETKGLSKKFGGYTALQNVDLALECGKIVGLLGPNGSGKTTLLKLLNGLLAPTSGTINIGGYGPGVISKQHVSYLPDANYFPRWMKVNNLFEYFSDFFADFQQEKAEDMLKKLDIAITMKLAHMSKGTLEKVQLVLAMSRDANLYCLDEPIGGVDPATRDYILKTIVGNYCENSTVIISTHLIASFKMDRSAFIRVWMKSGKKKINQWMHCLGRYSNVRKNNETRIQIHIQDFCSHIYRTGASHLGGLPIYPAAETL